MQDEARGDGAGGWLAVVLAVILFAWMATAFLSAGMEAIDDAYISLRYARNLVEGYGLVYNPGEAVQGYTNFLWTLILAGILYAGLPPVPAACILGLGLGCGTLVLTALWSWRRVAPGLASAAAAPVLLAANAGFVVWSLRGLETPLFTLLLLAGGLLHLRRDAEAGLSPGAALLLALATLTRPEGALAMALTVAHLGWVRLARRRAPLLGSDLPALALFAILVGGYAGWATLYYGEPLPNTFHAKVGDPLRALDRGWRYLGKFAWQHPTGLPLLALPLCLLRRPRRDATRSYCALLAGGFALNVVGVGGDVFPAYRFLVPIFPFLYILVGDGLAAAETAARRRPGSGGVWLARGGVAAVLTALAVGTLWPSRVYAWREWRGGNTYTREMRMVGTWLRESVRPGTWIAVNPAGALPYESRLPTIDMLGLNDREIARTSVAEMGSGRLAGHEKGNGESVFRRRPGIILIGGVKLERPPPDPGWILHGRSERELSRIPDLFEVYAYDRQVMPDGRVLTLLRRRDQPVYRWEAPR